MKKKLASVLLSTLFITNCPSVMAQINGPESSGVGQGQGVGARVERDAVDASIQRNYDERRAQERASASEQTDAQERNAEQMREQQAGVNERAEQQDDVDNTSRNKQDRKTSAVTAEQQSNDRRDIVLTQRIRKELLDNQDLSDYAKNVKVITRSGKVVLRGPVDSTKEKNDVEMVARNIAGAENVDNEITVEEKDAD